MYKAKIPEAWARVEWCKKQFGGSGIPDHNKRTNIVEGMRWWRRQGHLFFREEKDFVLYTLRWSLDD